MKKEKETTLEKVLCVLGVAAVFTGAWIAFFAHFM